MSDVSGVRGPYVRAVPAPSRRDARSVDDYTAYLESKARDPGTMDQDMAYYLELQKRMLKEQQLYTMISTIMKARHDSSMTAIRNFR